MWAVAKASRPSACTASIRQIGRLSGGAMRKATQPIHMKAMAQIALVYCSTAGKTHGVCGRSWRAVSMLTVFSARMVSANSGTERRKTPLSSGPDRWPFVTRGFRLCPIGRLARTFTASGDQAKSRKSGLGASASQ